MVTVLRDGEARMHPQRNRQHGCRPRPVPAIRRCPCCGRPDPDQTLQRKALIVGKDPQLLYPLGQSPHHLNSRQRPVLIEARLRIINDHYLPAEIWVVSSLTRSADRVQRRPAACTLTSWASLWFQSSPGPQTGCNELQDHRARRIPCTRRFQSSPGPQTGCNVNEAMRTLLWEFQSSPGPQTGCNGGKRRWAASIWEFQSSPGPQTGCNCQIDRLKLAVGVSILTRSADRVQLSVSPIPRPVVSFQSSPGPQTGCNIGAPCGLVDGYRVSILTRSADRVQHRCAMRTSRRLPGFNPHPVRRPGATSVRHAD